MLDERNYMKLKWIGFFSLIAVAMFGYFYTLIQMPKNASFFIMLVLLGLILTAIISEFFKEQKREMIQTPTKELVYSFVFVVVGTLIPYYMSMLFDIHVVIGSAFVGILFHFALRKYEIEAYCGSFAGMISILVVGPFEILLVALLTGIVFVLAKPVWKGFGGKLGTIGFVGTVGSILILGKEFLAPITIPDETLFVVFSVLGVVTTYIVQHMFKQTATLASSATSLVVALIAHYILRLNPVYMTVFFAASFVGMADKTKINGLFTAAFAGFIIGYIFLMFAPYLNGAGGKLGTMAFLTTLSIHGMNELIIYTKAYSNKVR